MKFEKTLIIDRKTAEFYDKVLNSTDMMGEDDTYSETVDFGDGIEVDIKICGADNETPWTEAVMFCDGCEVSCSDAEDDIYGEWDFNYCDNEYVVIVERESTPA